MPDPTLMILVRDAERATMRAAEDAAALHSNATGSLSLAPQALAQAAVLIAGARALLEEH